MRVTFVALGCEQLPVSLLAAIARREGHDVGLAFSQSLFDDRFFFQVPRLARLFDDRAAVLAAIERQRPDVLAFSSLTTVYQWMLGIARDAKRMLPAVKVVFGGVHPSAVPDAVLATEVVDFVCVGEGDEAFPALLRELERGGPRGPIANLRYRDGQGALVRGPQAGFVQDLDSLPPFDKRIWEDHVRVGDNYLTMASRGCPYRCTFCFNNFFARLPEGQSGKYVRQRSVDHMMAELLAAKRRYKLRFVNFEDDIFTVNKSWLRSFLERYRKEIGVPFYCLTHAKYMDDDIARWLRDAGCEWTQMGIQSVDDEFKNKQLKRYERSVHVESALKALRKHGIKLKADHIFGLPGEPAGAQEAARRLYATHTPERIGTFWATYFPGTEMVDQGLALGLIDADDVRAISEGELRGYHSAAAAAGPDRAYELLFRLLPLLPERLRSRLSPEALQRLPAGAVSAAGFAVDAVNGLLRHNNDHLAYGLHYATQIGRAALAGLGIELPPATRPRDATVAFAAGPPTDRPRESMGQVTRAV